MKKSELLVKYKHHLTLKNFSESTIRAYTNGLHIFSQYVTEKGIQEITSKELEAFFYECKSNRGYSYSSMKQ